MEEHLAPRPANYVPLTPLEFLVRTVEAFPHRPAVVWRECRWTWQEFAALVARLAGRLSDTGIGAGDVVSLMATNRPEMLAAHYAVPMLGAVLNSINTRLDGQTVEYILRHSESRLLLCDPACAAVGEAAARAAGSPWRMLPSDHEATGPGECFDVLSDDGVARTLEAPAVIDEWQPICINYTSGTTGRPKGVVYHHRGAYLNAIGNVLSLGLTSQSSYLWILPMFHCNGWCHTWAVTAAGGLHVCLDQVDPVQIFRAIDDYAITHMACAPVVLYNLLNDPVCAGRQAGRRVTVAMGGAAPTSTLIEQIDMVGFDLVHLYGLTESYGPATLRVLDPAERTLSSSARAAELSKQGVRHVTAGRVRVLTGSGSDAATQGAMGEIVLRGNTLMAGYYRDPEATEAAFRGGVFHTGDLAVRHADGNIEIRDRIKDVIISGGENISSLEVENVLHQHSGVLLAAVVAMPDPKWGEVPCAFLEMKPGATASEDDLRAFCRGKLAGFKIPKKFVFQSLPRTATGKIQKFLLRQEARAAMGDAAGDVRA